MKAVNKPTEKYVEVFKSIAAKGFIPTISTEPRPINCKPINPSKLPPKILP